MSTSGLLSGNDELLFVILPPQRRFKWKNQQVDQLWQDILTALKAKRDSYFLGTLLLVQLGNGHKVSVIDGQQRITTLSMLLAVLRDYCYEFEDLRTRADGIQRLISRVDYDGKPVGSLVITLQNPDNQVYKKLVEEPGSTKSLPFQKDLLSRAVERLSEKVGQYIDGSDRKEKLRGLCQYIQSKVMFLPLDVGSEAQGFLVFDTTNTRGLRPSPSEALKARLATIARGNNPLSDDLIAKWNAAAEKLENADQPIDAMNDYIHAIWCSKHGHTSKQRLDRIASRLTDLNLLSDFVKDLDLYCDSYLAIVNPKGNSSLTEDLRDLNKLNIQSRSLLMMVHKNSLDRFEEAVDLVLSLQIRNVTVGPHQANAYEKDWPNWAMLLRREQTDKVFDDIRNRMVPDEDFQRQFEKEVVASSRTVRHILRRLDPISRPGSGVQPVNVDIEHILPKSVITKLIDGRNLTVNAKQWIKDLGYKLPKSRQEMLDIGKILEPYVNRLGNQALLNDKANRGAKDRPFAQKRNFYKNQALELTKSLSKLEKWGLKQISARQKELAKKAPSIWQK